MNLKSTPEIPKLRIPTFEGADKFSETRRNARPSTIDLIREGLREHVSAVGPYHEYRHAAKQLVSTLLVFPATRVRCEMQYDKFQDCAKEYPEIKQSELPLDRSHELTMRANMLLATVKLVLDDFRAIDGLRKDSGELKLYFPTPRAHEIARGKIPGEVLARYLDSQVGLLDNHFYVLNKFIEHHFSKSGIELRRTLRESGDLPDLASAAGVLDPQFHSVSRSQLALQCAKKIFSELRMFRSRLDKALRQTEVETSLQSPSRETLSALSKFEQSAAKLQKITFDTIAAIERIDILNNEGSKSWYLGDKSFFNNLLVVELCAPFLCVGLNSLRLLYDNSRDQAFSRSAERDLRASESTTTLEPRSEPPVPPAVAIATAPEEPETAGPSPLNSGDRGAVRHRAPALPARAAVPAEADFRSLHAAHTSARVSRESEPALVAALVLDGLTGDISDAARRQSEADRLKPLVESRFKSLEAWDLFARQLGDALSTHGPFADSQVAQFTRAIPKVLEIQGPQLADYLKRLREVNHVIARLKENDPEGIIFSDKLPETSFRAQPENFASVAGLKGVATRLAEHELELRMHKGGIDPIAAHALFTALAEHNNMRLSSRERDIHEFMLSIFDRAVQLRNEPFKALDTQLRADITQKANDRAEDPTSTLEAANKAISQREDRHFSEITRVYGQCANFVSFVKLRGSSDVRLVLCPTAPGADPDHSPGIIAARKYLQQTLSKVAEENPTFASGPMANEERRTFPRRQRSGKFTIGVQAGETLNAIAAQIRLASVRTQA